MKTTTRKQIIAGAAILFVGSCLVPPWEYLDDRSSIRLEGITIPGAHGRQPASYSFLFIPPRISGHNGVQIDFGRLFLEWGALAAVTGLAWMFVGKNE